MLCRILSKEASVFLMDIVKGMHHSHCMDNFVCIGLKDRDPLHFLIILYKINDYTVESNHLPNIYG